MVIEIGIREHQSLCNNNVNYDNDSNYIQIHPRLSHPLRSSRP